MLKQQAARCRSLVVKIQVNPGQSLPNGAGAAQQWLNMIFNGILKNGPAAI